MSFFADGNFYRNESNIGESKKKIKFPLNNSVSVSIPCKARNQIAGGNKRPLLLTNFDCSQLVMSSSTQLLVALPLTRLDVLLDPYGWKQLLP